MKKQPRQIEKRLARCPIKEYKDWRGTKVPMYDFMTAMAYLVQPKGDIEDWMSQNNAASLPPHLNKMFWDSAHQRSRVLIDSGDLWHTEDVMLVLGRVAMLIEQETTLWVEDLPGKDYLSTDQFNKIVDLARELVITVQEKLVKLPGETRALSWTIKEELDTSGRMVSDEDRVENDDD
jgi:hypothetical protein